jgi:nitrate/nitrite-specific signal transduction histidine kinase
MTDARMMTLALAVIVPLSMLIYSNSRITETRETLRAEIAATKETLRAEIAAGFARMSSEIQSLKADLKIHVLEHHK